MRSAVMSAEWIGYKLRCRFRGQPSGVWLQQKSYRAAASIDIIVNSYSRQHPISVDWREQGWEGDAPFVLKEGLLKKRKRLPRDGDGDKERRGMCQQGALRAVDLGFCPVFSAFAAGNLSGNA